jgi:tape measure domain-containing protein
MEIERIVATFAAESTQYNRVMDGLVPKLVTTTRSMNTVIQNMGQTASLGLANASNSAFAGFQSNFQKIAGEAAKMAAATTQSFKSLRQEMLTSVSGLVVPQQQKVLQVKTQLVGPDGRPLGAGLALPQRSFLTTPPFQFQPYKFTPAAFDQLYNAAKVLPLKNSKPEDFHKMLEAQGAQILPKGLALDKFVPVTPKFDLGRARRTGGDMIASPDYMDAMLSVPSRKAAVADPFREKAYERMVRVAQEAREAAQAVVVKNAAVKDPITGQFVSGGVNAAASAQATMQAQVQAMQAAVGKVLPVGGGLLGGGGGGHMPGFGGRVSAFDRPISVIVVGPRPLPVMFNGTVGGGLPGFPGGSGGLRGAAKDGVFSWMERWIQRIALFTVLAGVTSSAFEAGKAALQMAMDFERAGIAFEVMTRSAATGKELLASVNQLALESPFKSKDLILDAKQLKAFGFEADQITPTLAMLGDVSSATSTDISRIVLAYGQVRVAGRLLGTELRQFSDAGIPLMDELAAVMNKPVEVIRTMVHDGQIGFPEVQAAFQRMTGEGGRFYGLMQRINRETVGGRWENLTENIQVLLRNLGGSFFEGFGVKDVLNDMIESTKSFNPDKMRDFFVFIRGISREVVSLISFTHRWATENKTLVATLAGFGTGILSYGLAVVFSRMLLNLVTALTRPFGHLLANVVSLVIWTARASVATVAFVRSGQLLATLATAGNAVVGFFMAIPGAAMSAVSAVLPFVPLIATLTVGLYGLAKTGFFRELADDARSAFDGFSETINVVGETIKEALAGGNLSEAFSVTLDTLGLMWDGFTSVLELGWNRFTQKVGSGQLAATIGAELIEFNSGAWLFNGGADSEKRVEANKKFLMKQFGVDEGQAADFLAKQQKIIKASQDKIATFNVEMEEKRKELKYPGLPDSVTKFTAGGGFFGFNQFTGDTGKPTYQKAFEEQVRLQKEGMLNILKPLSVASAMERFPNESPAFQGKIAQSTLSHWLESGQGKAMYEERLREQQEIMDSVAIKRSLATPDQAIQSIGLLGGSAAMGGMSQVRSAQDDLRGIVGQFDDLNQKLRNGLIPEDQISESKKQLRELGKEAQTVVDRIIDMGTAFNGVNRELRKTVGLNPFAREAAAELQKELRMGVGPMEKFVRQADLYRQAHEYAPVQGPLGGVLGGFAATGDAGRLLKMSEFQYGLFKAYQEKVLPAVGDVNAPKLPVAAYQGTSQAQDIINAALFQKDEGATIVQELVTANALQAEGNRHAEFVGKTLAKIAETNPELIPQAMKVGK